MKNPVECCFFSLTPDPSPSPSVLALWRLGRCRHWRPHPDFQQPAGLHEVGREERVLERAAGEGLRQVSGFTVERVCVCVCVWGGGGV